VVAHFQNYLSSLAAPTTAPGAVQREGKQPESSLAAPQLSRAAAATEKPAASPIAGRVAQPNKATGPKSIAPEDSRPAPLPVSKAPEEAEPQISASTVNQAGQSAEAISKAHPTRALVPAPRPEESKPRGPSLLPPEQGPSWLGRLMRSIPFRIAAVLAVVGLMLYLGRDLLRKGRKSEVTPATQVGLPAQSPPPAQIPSEPAAESTAQPMSLPPQPEVSTPAPPKDSVAEVEPLTQRVFKNPMIDRKPLDK